jgi:hypothetical protein
MVSSISGSSSYQYQTQTDTKLTDAQKTKLADIISKYDPDNMTASSTKSMMDEIKNAGITPSKDLGETLNKAGFKPPEKPADATQSATTSTSSSTTTTSSSTVSSSSDDLKSQVLDLLTKEGATNISDDDINAFISNLKSSSDSDQGTIVDQFA